MVESTCRAGGNRLCGSKSVCILQLVEVVWLNMLWGLPLGIPQPPRAHRGCLRQRLPMLRTYWM